MHFLFQQLKPTTCLNTLGNLEPQLNSTNFESKKNALQIFPEKVNLWKEICKKKLISNLSSAQTKAPHLYTFGSNPSNYFISRTETKKIYI